LLINDVDGIRKVILLKEADFKEMSFSITCALRPFFNYEYYQSEYIDYKLLYCKHWIAL